MCTYGFVFKNYDCPPQVDASNVRELNIPDDEVEVLDQMLGGAEVVDNVNTNSWLDAEQEANLTRLALKKTIEDAADINVISRGVPPKLRIKPDDSEDVVGVPYGFRLY